MTLLDVRRLAALDMHGASGSRWRRRVVIVEFFGTVVCAGFGAWWLWSAGATGRLLALALAGIGANYFPLALHAATLTRPGALAGELAGVDVRGQLRRYSLIQLWLAVPGVVLLLALAQLVRRRTLTRRS
ncbi:hypothetical protein ACFFWC_12250 [Plantactinospora siamensis]|uniref:Uncharacterized protein n=1 Tax=Plantactinospora siamensis TaxID=555372 RepID=A0ABV6P1W0_9ACTN